MPLYLYKRPNQKNWYIRGTVQDEQFDRSARTSVRSEAEQIRAKWEAESFKSQVYGKRSVGAFSQAVTAYLRAGGDESHVEALLDRFGDTPLNEVNQAALDKWATERKTAAPATLVRQIYAPVSAIINFAASDAGGKLCDPVKFRKPKIRNARVDYLTPQQAADWLAALEGSAYLQTLVRFYLATGCRATEALSLEWKDVSPGGKRVVFWDTKADYPRGVDTYTGLPARPEKAEGAVFLNSRGEPWHGYDAINLMLKRHRERRAKAIVAGSTLPALAPVHCHLFRHTWATWAYACTRDLTFLMQQGGWRSLAMVGRYTHVGSRDLAQEILNHGWEFSGRQIAGLTPEGRKPQ